MGHVAQGDQNVDPRALEPALGCRALMTLSAQKTINVTMIECIA
jgi:hypothetical protein